MYLGIENPGSSETKVSTTATNGYFNADKTEGKKERKKQMILLRICMTQTKFRHPNESPNSFSLMSQGLIPNQSA